MAAPFGPPPTSATVDFVPSGAMRVSRPPLTSTTSTSPFGRTTGPSGNARPSVRMRGFFTPLRLRVVRREQLVELLGDLLLVLGLGHLLAPVGDDLADLVLADPCALDASRDRRRGTEQQHVALTDEPLGALLVEDDAAVGEARHRERETSRHVRL